MQQSEENDAFESMGLIERQIEALLFVSTQPVSSDELADHLGISAKRAETFGIMRRFSRSRRPADP